MVSIGGAGWSPRLKTRHSTGDVDHEVLDRQAKAGGVRLGCWTGAEILDGKDPESCASWRWSACGGDWTQGKSPASDSGAGEGEATLGG